MPKKRRVSVSGVLRYLGVSRSGYHAWKNRAPSCAQQRKIKIKEKIQQIHEESHQIYGAPKIADKLRKKGENITDKTVGNYMREMGLRAHWVKPYIQTTTDSDFSGALKNILDEQFTPAKPNAVWVSDITYI